MEGTALILCANGFRTDNAKTAHGLVRGGDRYRVVGIVDAKDAGLFQIDCGYRDQLAPH